MRYQIITFVFVLITQMLFSQEKTTNIQINNNDIMNKKAVKSEAEWKEILSPLQYEVLRKKGTERAFTGKYTYNKDSGIYSCAACGNDLFISDTKYESGCGWPSFYEPINDSCIIEKRDTNHGMIRTEIKCANCDSHLGHVFSDGPNPTGLRYCVNSVSLEFEENK